MTEAEERLGSSEVTAYVNGYFYARQECLYYLPVFYLIERTNWPRDVLVVQLIGVDVA